MDKLNSNNELENINSLYRKASSYIDHARQNIQSTVNVEIVKAYWCIGRDIVAEEQLGKERAGYGWEVLKLLSERLTKQYQRGFSVDTLERARKLYLAYKVDHEQKSATPLRISAEPAVLSEKVPQFSQNLSWDHCCILFDLVLLSHVWQPYMGLNR